MKSEKLKMEDKTRDNLPICVEGEDLTENSRLFERVCEILDQARERVARSVNTEMVRAYWLVGQAIVEDEQRGNEQADYGEQLVESLAARLKAEVLKGFQTRNLWRMRDFYSKNH